MARGPGWPAWNHKALISSWRGRGRDPPPSPAELSLALCGQGATQPMLPARSALAPGPKPRRSQHFFKTLNCHEKPYLQRIPRIKDFPCGQESHARAKEHSPRPKSQEALFSPCGLQPLHPFRPAHPCGRKQERVNGSRERFLLKKNRKKRTGCQVMELEMREILVVY